jgi:hypothetical protein
VTTGPGAQEGRPATADTGAPAPPPEVPRIDQAGRDTFAGLADVLVPAGGGLPSASQAGAAGPFLDAVLAARPDLGEQLAALLARAAGRDPRAVVAELRADDPAGFEVLAVAVPGAYFLNPEISAAFGYHGQEAVPIDPDAPPDWLQDGLLDSVKGRGPIYRPVS